MSKHQAIYTITNKINEIKSCIAVNNDKIGNSKTIELLLDSILAGIAEESATVPKLRLIK